MKDTGIFQKIPAIRGFGWIIDGVRDLRIVGLRGFGATEMGLSGEPFEGVVVGWRMRFGYGMQSCQMAEC
jgi:hypothetical protein